tara:strand:+ start:2438 stop:3607 length:1170 start_codon:yes stop_codon:yes gene_type:complete
LINIKQAVIFVGGKGERLLPLTKNIPKPLIDIAGYPFIFRLIDSLKKKMNLEEVVLLTGYLSDSFENFKDQYEKELNIKITINEAPVQYETFLRLKQAEMLLDQKFLLLYGDNFWDGDLEQHFKLSNQFEIVTSAYRIKNNTEDGNIMATEDKFKYKAKRSSDLNLLDFGYMIVNKKPLESLFRKVNKNTSFSSIALVNLDLGIVTTDIRHKSIGSLDKLENTRKYLSRKKIILLDRDGVLNNRAAKADYIKSPEEFVWKDNVLSTLKKLYKKKYRFFIISNQPGIARNKMTMDNLEKINSLIKKNAADYGFDFEEIVYCIHGWNDDCFCRKPNPGMFLYLQNKYNIQFSQHYYLGDEERDYKASKKVYSKFYNMKNIDFSSILKIHDL